MVIGRDVKLGFHQSAAILVLEQRGAWSALSHSSEPIFSEALRRSMRAPGPDRQRAPEWERAEEVESIRRRLKEILSECGIVQLTSLVKTILPEANSRVSSTLKEMCEHSADIYVASPLCPPEQFADDEMAGVRNECAFVFVTSRLEGLGWTDCQCVSRASRRSTFGIGCRFSDACELKESLNGTCPTRNFDGLTDRNLRRAIGIASLTFRDKFRNNLRERDTLPIVRPAECFDLLRWISSNWPYLTPNEEAGSVRGNRSADSLSL